METDNNIEKVQWLTDHLQNSAIFTKIRKDLQKEVAKSHIPLNQSEMRASLLKYIRESGWEVKLQNAVYRQLIVNPIPPPAYIPEPHSKEPLAFIRKAQATWEKRIVKSVNSMCTELSLPLARKRSAIDQATMASTFETLGADLNEKEFEKIKPVYAPKDFFEALVAVENPNFTPLRKSPSSIKGWGLVQVNLYTKDLHELRSTFRELEPNTCHCGVDDMTGSNTVENFETDWYKMGKKVVHNGSAMAARQFAKYGCPSGIRGEIWKQILCLKVDDVELLYFQQLKSYVIQHEMLVDSLVMKDIRITATNDDDYFVFEDLLYQAMLVFTRDTAVLKHFQQSSATAPKSYIRGKLGVQEFAVAYPPNGIMPFHGFSMHAAPLCYVCSHAPGMYFLFREMYTRYFFRLHTMSSHPQGIMSLCLLFENLLQTHEPLLLYHLKEVGAPPLRLVFSWMVYAFSGYLSTDQVLLLWDRILAYDSLELLPVMAMAILSYRRSNLMEVTSLQAAQTVLADVSTLNVISLLQYVLFLK
ncbi:TBC1 domain family member 19 [Nematostella vectensis]|uniref:TBC1 domain family member 19 n=1 Tax=Nematostella vectensis TaxID=45351 RepID=UPI0020770429|nr:TBC1 domain family member 19 [Nematostella vectensis]